MNNIILFLSLTFSILINSQEIRKSELIGEWKFKFAIKNTEISNDSLSKLLTKQYGIDTIVTDEGVIRSDLTITNDLYKADDFQSDLWTISDNEIIINSPVPSNKLEYYKNNTVGVIEKLENGKYYFAGYQYRIKILSINENELRIEDFPYDLTYERK